MKQFFIFFYFIIWAFCASGQGYSSEPSIQENNPELSVWKIRSSDRDGTGVFLKKNQFITTFDKLLGLLNDEDFLKSMVLSQDGNSSLIGVERILFVSPIHNLAVLETGEDVTHHLNLEDNLSWPPEDLSLSIYLTGDLQITRKTGGDIFYEDERVYMFPYNFPATFTDGIKGSPVWNEKGQLVGIASEGLFQV